MLGFYPRGMLYLALLKQSFILSFINSFHTAMATDTFNTIEVPEEFQDVVEDIKVLAQITGHWVGQDTPKKKLYGAVEEGRRLNLIGPDEWSRMRMILGMHGMQDVRA